MREYLHKFFYILGDKRKQLIILVSFFLLSSMFDLFGIGLIGPFIAAVSSPKMLADSSFWAIFKSFFGITEDNNGLIAIGSIIIIVFYIKGFLAYWIRKYIVSFSFRHRSDLMSRLMSVYQSMSYIYHIKRNTASLIQTIVGLTNVYTGEALIPMLKLVSEMIVFGVLMLFLASTDFFSMLILIGLIVVVFLLYDKVVKHRIQLSGKESALASQEIIKGITEGIEGLKEIRVLGREQYFHNKIQDNAINYANAGSRYQGLQVMPRYLMESSMITFVVGLTMITNLMEGGTSNILPMLGMFGVAAIRLVPSTNQMIAGVISMRYSSHAMNKLYDDLKEVDDIMFNAQTKVIQPLKPGHDIHKPRSSFRQVELINISYQYPGAEMQAISNLSLSIKYGKSMGLIGKSGSGKTTLVNILLGLLEPQHGSVEVNGEPINNDIQKWLNRVAYIPQSIFLIDDALGRNIALGIPDGEIDDAQLAKAIDMAQLTSVEKQLPDGVDTVIGEKGVILSGGQRQRVALARAFYHRREVIIMDEATAALDNETEQQVVNAINSLRGKKTLIVIAHRISTVKHCDEICRLDAGRIVEKGSFESVVGA